MNVYGIITERILKNIEAGVVPWRQTWANGLPKSAATGREYRGINLLMLGSAGFGSRYWMTFRQAERLGGHVLKGQRASTVVYWKWRTAEELEQRRQKTGQNPAPCVPFTGSVFNLDQIAGVERPEDDVIPSTHQRLERADQLVEIMPDKPLVEHCLTHQPAYFPMADRIRLPHLSQFENAEAYYAVLFHELIHATGHPKRLGRFSADERESREEYSFEELVAEFGSAFLGAFTGITRPQSEALHASYIEGWARVFRKDPRILMRAASAAQHAADYVRGKVIAKESLVAA